MNQIKKYFFLFLLLLSFTNCFNDGQEQNNKLPYVFVQFDVNLSTSIGGLVVVGGFEVFDYNGRRILIYRSGENDFRAYDLACPHLYPSECSVPMRADDSTFPFVICDCGDEEVKYSIGNIPVEVDGEYYQMKEYFVVLIGSTLNGTLRITN